MEIADNLVDRFRMPDDKVSNCSYKLADVSKGPF
jgi:hypothetical protein